MTPQVSRSDEVQPPEVVNPSPDDQPGAEVETVMEEPPAEPHPEPTPVGALVTQDNVTEPGLQTTRYADGSVSEHDTRQVEQPEEDEG